MGIQDHDSSALISVVVPAYHAAATIQRALAGVARQTYRPIEVIVVDDGSSDDTAELAENYAHSMSGIAVRVIRQPNQGAGAARNRAIAEARGKYIAFLDADDEWLPEKLVQSIARLERNNLALVAHNGWIIDGVRETYLDIAARYRSAQKRLFDGLYRRGFISTSSVVARRVVVVAAGGFDEELRTGQDFDLWLKILADPQNTFEVFEEPLTRYHITRDSITSHTRRRLENTIEIAVRHAPALARHGGSPLGSLWFRLFAVHGEAIQAYWRRREWRHALIVTLKMPLTVVRATARYLGRKNR